MGLGYQPGPQRRFGMSISLGLSIYCRKLHTRNMSPLPLHSVWNSKSWASLGQDCVRIQTRWLSQKTFFLGYLGHISHISHIQPRFSRSLPNSDDWWCRLYPCHTSERLPAKKAMEKDRHGHGHLLNGNGMVEKLGTIGGSCRKIGPLVEIRQFELDEIPKGLEVWMVSFPFRKVKPAITSHGTRIFFTDIKGSPRSIARSVGARSELEEVFCLSRWFFLAELGDIQWDIGGAMGIFSWYPWDIHGILEFDQHQMEWGYCMGWWDSNEDWYSLFATTFGRCFL